MTDNELIAEFMGAEIVNSVAMFNGNAYSLIAKGIWPDAKYSTSWDWLMPVVEKIESGCNDIYAFNIYLHSSDVEKISGDFIVHPINSKSKIEAAHKAVVEFIKWYNDQKTL